MTKLLMAGQPEPAATPSPVTNFTPMGKLAPVSYASLSTRTTETQGQPFLPFPVVSSSRTLKPISPCICIYLGVECLHNLDKEKAPPVASTTDEAVNPNVIAHAQVGTASIVPQPRSVRQGCVMEAREAKGLALAAAVQPHRQNNVYTVPSQSGGKTYTVDLAADPPTCTCPDYAERKCECKHIFAVKFARERESGATLPEPPQTRKPTYKQDWPAYNLAQTNEKAKFQELLYELTKDVEDMPRKQGASGRNRLPLGDMIFSAAFKTYSLFSGRRFISDASSPI